MCQIMRSYNKIVTVLYKIYRSIYAIIVIFLL